MKIIAVVTALSLSLSATGAHAVEKTINDYYKEPDGKPLPKASPPKFAPITPPERHNEAQDNVKKALLTAVVIYTACRLAGYCRSSDTSNQTSSGYVDEYPGDGYTSGWGSDGLLYCYPNSWQMVNACWGHEMLRRNADR